jgi:hypothetical protein
MVIKLNTRFSHATWGENTVNISLKVPGNLAHQTSLSTKSTKTEPIKPPYTVTFRSTEISSWNNLTEPFSVAPTPTFEYWTFGGSGNNTYAYFQNGSGRGLPGILASGCFSLEADEYYLITYRYRGSGITSPENLHVLRDRADGTSDILFADTDIRTTTYSTKSVPFKGIGDGKERIRFLSNYNFSAQGIYIDQFTIKVDTASWPADAKMVRIVAPQTDTGLSVDEPIIIEVANINRRPLTNLYVFYSIDGGGWHKDSIPFLGTDSTTTFTFRQRAYLGEFRTYEITAFVDVVGDVDRSNDTVQKTVINHRRPDPPVSISNLHKESPVRIYPNPATTEVFIKSEKEISTLFIYDMRGLRVKEIRINNTEYHLNTSDFPAGIYLFSTIIGYERISQRVVINYHP